jgi:hypothetical protein
MCAKSLPRLGLQRVFRSLISDFIGISVVYQCDELLASVIKLPNPSPGFYKVWLIAPHEDASFVCYCPEVHFVLPEYLRS